VSLGNNVHGNCSGKTITDAGDKSYQAIQSESPSGTRYFEPVIKKVSEVAKVVKRGGIWRRAMKQLFVFQYHSAVPVGRKLIVYTVMQPCLPLEDYPDRMDNTRNVPQQRQDDVQPKLSAESHLQKNA